jgi:hypothetical protein
MRPFHAALAVFFLIATAGCGQDSQPRPHGAAAAPAAPAAASYPVNVVHPLGIGPIRFGDSRKKLLDGKLVVPGEQGCDGARVYDVPQYADLVFDAHDQLALVWVFTPAVKTPENLSVDSPVDAVRKAYPGAEELRANRNSFPGLLVKGEHTGYLFLYEPTTKQVVKLLAGYTDVLRAGHSAGITS